MAASQNIKLVNVSVGKTAIQSSKSKALPNQPEDALVCDADHARGYAFETSGSDFPFWQVDLGTVHQIEEIRVRNRRDHFQYRARSLTVEVSTNAKDWVVVHSGLQHWYDTVTFKLGGQVKGRFVRLRLQERTLMHLDRVEVFARQYEPYGKPVFVANRTDGLGERLNAMLNGLWLSEIFGSGFKFSWSDRFKNDPDHAIDTPERTFSPEFLAAHQIPQSATSGIWELAGKGRSFVDLGERMAKTGLVAAPRVALTDFMAAEPALKSKGGLQRAFKRIGFAPRIAEVVTLAEKTSIPENAVALHLRSGDVFFGDYRKYLHYTYKGLTLPLSKQIIAHFKDLDQPVYIFGQDKDAISYLCKTSGAVNANTLNADNVAQMDDTQAAIYDLVLLSQFKRIVGGSSGFSRQAGWIGASEVTVAHQMFPATTQTAFAIKDLKKNAATYHNLHSGIGYWYAYFYGRAKRNLATSITLMKSAYQWDPQNELYAFVLAVLYCRNGDAASGNQVLETLFLDRFNEDRAQEVFRVFNAKTIGAYNLAEYMPDLEGMAENSFWAACLNLSKARAENSESSIKKWQLQCKLLATKTKIDPEIAAKSMSH
jgi:hypothetical protein